MPKRRVLAYSLDPNQPGDQFLFNLLIAPVAIMVNFVVSLPGAIAALVAGRLHSRVPATILIAVGAFVADAGDTLSRFGVTELFQLGKFLGVLFLFAGFLVSIEVVPRDPDPVHVDPGRRRAARGGGAAETPPRRRGLAPARHQAAGRSPGPRHPDRVLPWSRCPTPHRPPIAGAAIVLIAASLFGTLGPLSRFAYDAGMEPLAFVAWRGAIGFLADGRVRRVADHPRGARLTRPSDLDGRRPQQPGHRGGHGLVLNLCMFIAFDRITVALALLGFYTYPAMVAAGNVALGREPLDRPRVVALALALAGMVAVVASQLDPAAGIRFDRSASGLASGPR